MPTKEVNPTQEPLNESLFVILLQKRVISAITQLLNGFLSLWMYHLVKNNLFFFLILIFDGPFVEDKEFFSSLPTLPIIDNSTKTVQAEESDWIHEIHQIFFFA